MYFRPEVPTPAPSLPPFIPPRPPRPPSNRPTLVSSIHNNTGMQIFFLYLPKNYSTNCQKRTAWSSKRNSIFCCIKISERRHYLIGKVSWCPFKSGFRVRIGFSKIRGQKNSWIQIRMNYNLYFLL